MSEKNFGFNLTEREHVSLDELRTAFLKESTEPFPQHSLETTFDFCQALDE